MQLAYFIAGAIAGLIAFAVNVPVQFFLQGSINWLSALSTALGVGIIFSLLTMRHK